MAPHRKILLVLSITLVGGSLAWTAWYGLRIRSAAYRREVEAKLARFFELPCDVGTIRGRTFNSRSFEDVHVWLPDRRDRIFSCKQAVWQENERSGRPVNELDLSDGVLILGTDRWVGSDYRQVLESGLGHDFEQLDLHRVGLERFEILFDRGGLSIRCRETSGNIDMSNPKDGVAGLTAYELNGHRVSQGVRIHARFLPSKAIVVSELILSLPQVPLSVLSADSPAFGRISSGRFAGTVQYLGSASPPELRIGGDLDDADLGEVTGALPIGPLQGRLSVKVSEARLRHGVVTDLHGHGHVKGLLLSPLAALLGRESLSGSASLRLDAVDLVGGRLDHLAVSGQVRDLSLREWLAPLGRGAATGGLSVRINNVDLQGEQIKSADIELSLRPPAGETGRIDRELLLAAAERLLRFNWPSSVPQEVLPEKVSYVECGVRLLVRDNQLRVLGTHGENADTILTINLFGRPFGIIKEQSGTIDLAPWIAKAQERLRAYSPERIREWWESGGFPTP
jgi:hypothetical protein